MEKCKDPNHLSHKPASFDIGEHWHVVQWHEYDKLKAGIVIKNAKECSYARTEIVIVCDICNKLVAHCPSFKLPYNMCCFSGNPWELANNISEIGLALGHRIKCRNVVQPEKLVDPNFTCSICDERVVDTRLNCGHCNCSVCAQKIEACALCRAPIKSRDRLFFV